MRLSGTFDQHILVNLTEVAIHGLVVVGVVGDSNNLPRISSGQGVDCSLGLSTEFRVERVGIGFEKTFGFFQTEVTHDNWIAPAQSWRYVQSKSFPRLTGAGNECQGFLAIQLFNHFLYDREKGLSSFYVCAQQNFKLIDQNNKRTLCNEK